MQYQDFSQAIAEIAPLLNWNLTDRAIKSLWRRLPNEVDDECLMGALEDAVEAQARVPAMLTELYKQRRRQAVSEQAGKKPRLAPDRHDGKPCVEFVQVCRMVREMKAGQFPDLKAACQHLSSDEKPHCGSHSLDCRCLAEWNARPLTEEDWRIGRATEPNAPLASFAGGSVEPDPKESDVVWL